LLRGVILSIIATGAAIGAALSQTPPLDTRALIAIGMGAFFGGLLSRLGEGGYDAIRDVKGQTLPSDVTPNVTPVPPPA
jgi:hypothetical protein